MKSRGEDITGQRFGALVALRPEVQSKNKTWKWRVRCDCGREQVVFITALKKSKRLCRECQKSEISARRTTHGMTFSPTYLSWKSMKARCLNPKSPDYKDYGGRGITICESWIDSFEAFLEDMGERPKNRTLDRRDTNGNYEPDNCVWSTAKEQANNRRNSKTGQQAVIEESVV